MGYETRIIVVESYSDDGYLSVIADIEMRTIAVNHMGALIENLQKESKKKEKTFKTLLDKYFSLKHRQEEAVEEMHEGFPEKDDDLIGIGKKVWDAEYKLRSKKLPFFFEGNDAVFEDSYGNLLLIADLDAVILALEQDRAKDILENGYNYYRRYDMAIAVLKSFSEDKWSMKTIKVILFGH